MADEDSDIRTSDARVRQLVDLRAGNGRGLVELRGRGVPIDTTRLRLDVLIEVMFTEEDRLEYELAYEQAVFEQITRARLAAGARDRSPSKLIVPGRG